MSDFSKDLQYRLEAVFINGLLALLGLMPVDASSAISGRLMRLIGPHMKRHKRVMANLKKFMPELSDQERKNIALTMWENAGRTFGETPHSKKILEDPKRFRFIGMEETVKDLGPKQGAVAISGHFGSWELSPAPSCALKKPQLSFYRTIKNPYIDRRLKQYREEICTGELVAKGADSMKRAMRAVQKGYFIGMLVDQRESQGIMVPFLGEDAPTNHAPALLVCRYGVPLYAGIVIREKGAHFRMECQKIEPELTGDNKADVVTVTRQINDLMSEWIRKYPDQWLWATRRW